MGGEPNTSLPASPWLRLGLAVFTLLFVFWSTLFIHHSSLIAIDGQRYFCLFDDAMISMRYAWNMSHGIGLVWNAGEYVQGYSNVLMTMLMALATVVGDKSVAVLVIQGSGIVFILLSAGLAARMVACLSASWEQQWSTAAVLFSFALVLLYYPLTYWSLMGMETGLLSVLLLSGAYMALLATRSGAPRHVVLSTVFLGMAFLARMDAVLPSMPLLAAVMVMSPVTKPNGRVKRILAVAGGYGGVVLLLVGFQYFYYGSALPNTFTLKLVGVPITQRLSDGLMFTALMAKHSLPFWILAAASLFWKDQGRRWLLLSAAVMTILYQILAGGDAWPMWRFTAPVMPMVLSLAVLSVLGAARSVSAGLLSRLICSERLRRTVTLTAAGLLFLALVLHANREYWPQMVFSRVPFQVEHSQTNVNIAVTLANVTTPTATVAVLWAGAIPYYSGRKAIDMLGKSDPRIAALEADVSGRTGWNGLGSVPGHNKYDLSWSIQQKRPTFVQSFVWGGQNISAWGGEHYVNASYHGFPVLLLKDSPDVLWDSLSVRE